MVDTAARYQAHPAPGSVAELESLFSWLEAQRSAWLEHPDAVAAWHRNHLDIALRLVYREIVARAAVDGLSVATISDRLAGRPLVNGIYQVVGPRCEDPICPAEHVDGRHPVSAG